jgi:uncharacterized protein
MTTPMPEDQWVNEPAEWSAGAGSLSLRTDAGTDFWRTTHYGFVRDTGHFRGRRVAGDFVAEAKVRAAYTDQYDQAGLMVRLDAERWVKTGIELVDGKHQMSAVVTHGVSDWSVTTLAEPPDVLALRVTRDGDALTIDYAVDGRRWHLHRMAFFPPALPVLVGPMAASPDGQGFAVEFTGLTVDPR